MRRTHSLPRNPRLTSCTPRGTAWPPTSQPPRSGADNDRSPPLRQPPRARSRHSTPAQMDVRVNFFHTLFPGAGQTATWPLSQAASQEKQEPRRARPPRTPSWPTAHHFSHQSVTGRETNTQARPAGWQASPTQTGGVCNSNGIFLSLFFRSTVRQIARQTDQKKTISVRAVLRP